MTQRVRWMTTQRLAILSAVLMAAGLLLAAWAGGLGGVLVSVALVALLGLYMLPSILASDANHRHLAAIVALNVLLGWTGLGWLVTLEWALRPQRRA